MWFQICRSRQAEARASTSAVQPTKRQVWFSISPGCFVGIVTLFYARGTGFDSASALSFLPWGLYATNHVGERVKWNSWWSPCKCLQDQVSNSLERMQLGSAKCVYLLECHQMPSWHSKRCTYFFRVPRQFSWIRPGTSSLLIKFPVSRECDWYNCCSKPATCGNVAGSVSVEVVESDCK